MCGICGVVALDGPLDPAIRQAMPAMTRALRHRGPDGEGLFSDPYAALGHRRLAILDRAGGKQPIGNEDGSRWVVFNGEIYNHHALRRELVARGHVFRTKTDTEAILHAYEEFGPACVDRFDGMFAFAIYDTARRELFIARDRLGKKPLFYGTFGGAFHFASEIKAIARSPVWDDSINAASLEGYLSLGYFVAPGTIYRHVHKLEPGHWLRLRAGRLEVRKYWDIEGFDDDSRDETSILANLEELLTQAVRARLESEVPLGAFLSGGIDSGLVVSLMAEARPEPMTTSVGFGERAHNELDLAALTATHCGTRHHAALVNPRLDEILDQIVEAFDEPFADSSAIPTYYVSSIARQNVTVALSGDGGDETFGGYGFRYVPHALEAAARTVVRGHLGTRAARWLGAHWPASPRLPRAMRLRGIWENLGRDPAGAYYNDLCFLKLRSARALLGLHGNTDPHESFAYATISDAYHRCQSTSAVQRAQYADLKIYLPNDVLVKVDRMSMLHGLEVRCPILDHRIVEFAFRVPTRRKMPHLEPKHLLRRLARRRLPPRLLQAPKHGFTAPIAVWLRGRYAEQFRGDVLSQRAITSRWIDTQLVRSMFEAHREGCADHSYALWAIWMCERWAQLREHATKGVCTAKIS